MMDKYIQMDFQLPSQRIFGLGERNREFGLTEGTWTMWAVGRETPYDDGSGGLQTYGVHPFVLVQTKSKGRYMGMYFRNSNGQSPVVKFNEDGTSVLSYITTGGVIDVYFFLKASAKQII
jgi:alpha-glucosidase (family GH31 glycosyl hydrolase)